MRRKLVAVLVLLSGLSGLGLACAREPIGPDPAGEGVAAADRARPLPAMAVVPRFASPAEREPEVDVCTPGQQTRCFVGFGVPAAPGSVGRERGPYMMCRRDANGTAFWSRESCATPLVVVLDDAPVRFTRPEGAFAIGESPRTEWVSAETPWLALDRDGSGCIESDRELFAGFAALRLLDANGDGVLDRRDPAYAELLLWSDRDQDRRCTPDELAPLGLDALPLDAETMPWTGYSVEGEIAPLPGRRGRVSDVYLAPM